MKFQYLENTAIYKEVVLNEIPNTRKSLWIATANVKDLHYEEVPPRRDGRRLYVSILKIFRDLCRKGIDVRILHSDIPSEFFLRDFKAYKLSMEKNFKMKRCPRVHFKAVLVDKSNLLIGSPNLTGAGLDAKGENRRNFEIGILTDSPAFIKNVQLLFTQIWEGNMCKTCGRKQVCYVPLEQPV